MQFRSLHSLARRALAAGAASALALTLFNAVQPTLAPHHQIGPGTIKDVPVTLVPTAAASLGAASPGAVDNAASSSAESATLPLWGAETRPAAMKAAPGAGMPSGPGR